MTIRTEVRNAIYPHAADALFRAFVERLAFGKGRSGDFGDI